MIAICINPSCCNVDTFEGERCPYCDDVMIIDTGSIDKLLALSDDDYLIELSHLGL